MPASSTSAAVIAARKSAQARAASPKRERSGGVRSPNPTGFKLEVAGVGAAKRAEEAPGGSREASECEASEAVSDLAGSGSPLPSPQATGAACGQKAHMGLGSPAESIELIEQIQWR